MGADAAGEGELSRKGMETGCVLTLFRIEAGVRAFEVDGAEDAGGCMAGAGEEDHGLVELLNGAVEVV